jgi:hypothetical protein
MAEVDVEESLRRLATDLSDTEHEFNRQLQEGFRVLPSSVMQQVQQAGAPGADWPAHVLMLLERSRSSSGGGGGSGSSAGHSNGGGGGGSRRAGRSKGGRRMGGRSKGGGGGGGPGSGNGRRSVLEWLESSLDSVLLVEQGQEVGADALVRMRAIAGSSVRQTSGASASAPSSLRPQCRRLALLIWQRIGVAGATADLVEWRELHASPMHPASFGAAVQSVEDTLGSPLVLPTLAPGPPDGTHLLPHPAHSPWR